MNYPVIGYVLAWVIEIEGFLMLAPCLVAVVYGEKTGFVYLLGAAVCLAIGLCGTKLKKPKDMSIYRKEGMVTVALAWVVMSLLGAVPFIITGEIPSFIDAVFEIVSGFTTTGASILSDVEAVSHPSLLWRSFSHWIGGMGVLVFILMLIPVREGAGTQMNLMRAESPGYDISKLAPKVSNTARILYKLYLIITIIEMIALLLSGMNWFDAVCITFGTAGTGGFGVLNTSCGSYTALQQVIITVFMIAFGVNFSFYFLISVKRVKTAVMMEEVRVYLLIIAAAVLTITINTAHMYSSVSESMRHAFFQVGSIITTTGYSSVDFDQWPSLSKAVLILLMCIGACAGSTGGGIKVSRIMIYLKAQKRRVNRFIHPHTIETIRMDGNSVPEHNINTIMVFLAAYCAIFALSVLLISIDGFSFETNFTAVAATLNNIGPGLAKVGPTLNYGSYSIFSKIVLIFNMLAGRLEIFPMLVLVFPPTWRRRF